MARFGSTDKEHQHWARVNLRAARRNLARARRDVAEGQCERALSAFADGALAFGAGVAHAQSRSREAKKTKNRDRVEMAVMRLAQQVGACFKKRAK